MIYKQSRKSLSWFSYSGIQWNSWKNFFSHLKIVLDCLLILFFFMTNLKTSSSKVWIMEGYIILQLYQIFPSRKSNFIVGRMVGQSTSTKLKWQQTRGVMVLQKLWNWTIAGIEPYSIIWYMPKLNFLNFWLAFKSPRIKKNFICKKRKFHSEKISGLILIVVGSIVHIQT